MVNSWFGLSSAIWRSLRIEPIEAKRDYLGDGRRMIFGRPRLQSVTASPPTCDGRTFQLGLSVPPSTDIARLISHVSKVPKD